MEIVVPYFKAGLENSEACVWVTADLQESKEAKEALKKAIPDIETYLEKGQMEIIPIMQEYLKEVTCEPEKVLAICTDKLSQVLAAGYAGLRTAGENSCLEKKNWNGFVSYEGEMDRIIPDQKMLVLCIYPLTRYDQTEIIDAVLNHQFTLIKRKGSWEKIESPRRKQAEESAIKAAKAWEHTFDAVPDPIAVLDNKFRVVRVNRAMAARLGVSPEACIGATCYRAIHGTDRPPASCPHIQLLKDKKEHITEIREDNLGGDFIVSVSPIYDSRGGIAGCIHVARDINERKQAEEILIRSENNFRTLAENSPDIIVRFNREKYHVYANPAASRVYELSQEEIIGKTHRELGMDPEKIKFCEEKCERIFTSGQPEITEFRYISPAGKEYYFNTQLVPEFADGKVVSVLSISRDITALKKAEFRLKDTLDNLEALVEERTSELEKAFTSLKESEASLAEAQRIARLGSWSWDIETNKTSGSDETYRIFGLSPQELKVTYDGFLSRVSPTDQVFVDNCIKAALKGKNLSVDFQIVRADGEERSVHLHAETLFNEEKKPVRMLGTVQDITERKKIEQALEESEERYRSFIQNFKGIAFKLDTDLSLEFMKGDVEEITGYSETEIISENLWRKLIEPDDLLLFLKKLKEMKKSPSGYEEEIEYRIKSKDGKIKWMYGIYQKIPGRDESPDKYQGVIYDVTEKKYAEEMLLNIEAARKKEIHHRIKNNLQVISSLLDLQLEKFRNKVYIDRFEFLEAFRESQDRVLSIALIHEELHEGRGTDKLDFSPYLHRLIESLFETYNVGNFDLSLNIDLEENIYFDMDVAVPLGLIVNEIVSNSLKYAFKNRDKGKMQIKLYREASAFANSRETGEKQDYNEKDDTDFFLTVSDDGAGLPETVNLEEPDTLGLQLILILIDQLNGKLELNRGSGTEYIIRFTVPGIQ